MSSNYFVLIVVFDIIDEQQDNTVEKRESLVPYTTLADVTVQKPPFYLQKEQTMRLSSLDLVPEKDFGTLQHLHNIETSRQKSDKSLGYSINSKCFYLYIFSMSSCLSCHFLLECK